MTEPRDLAAEHVALEGSPLRPAPRGYGDAQKRRLATKASPRDDDLPRL
jgi:hypothetical protein